MDTENQKDDRKSAKTRVKVAIRVRPMIPKQIANNEVSCVEFKSNDEIILAKQRNYKFDYVFRDNSPQSEVYESCVKDLVNGCFQGYNSAILAYGQTGSGKTFTMGTAVSTLDSGTNQGIIPRVIRDIFMRIDQKKKEAEFIIKASFIQIYNQQILDLLSDSIKTTKNKQQNITIREQKDGSVSLCNVTQEQVSSSEQMMGLLERGGYHRTTATTLMNDASSRSHAIFTIFIQQHRIDDLYQKQGNQKKQGKKQVENDNGFMTAKFFFVDLAGSERAKKTGATGATLKQGININLGLLELGNVISALATIEKKQDQFITYRNSKLTRILQECLGGNSNTFMIACASPAESNFEESLNTLKYASKAMNIKNKPIKNVDPHTAQISQLKQKIYELEMENRKLKNLLNQKGVNIEQQIVNSTDAVFEERKKLKKMYVLLEKKYEELLLQNKQEKKNKNQYQINQYELKRQRDIILLKIQTFRQKYPKEFMRFNEIEQGFEVENKDVNVLNELSEKIQILNNEINDKNQINMELQKEFERLVNNCRNDQKLLVNKNTVIHQLRREIQVLNKTVNRLNRGADNNSVQISGVNRDVDQIEIDGVDQQNYEIDESMDLPVELMQNERDFNSLTNQTEQQLSLFDRQILQKQREIESMSSNQIKLEYQLIEQMKQQYHKKIMILQKQKGNLVKMRDESVGVNQKNKFINKIDNLQNELKDYKKKDREQKNLQKLVNNQNNKIKDLANQIKKFKMQKMEMSRKLKQDKDNFQKYKTKKIKQIFNSKKQNIKKQNQIKKLILDNTKKNQSFKKKQQELYRAKRINQTLKNLLKPQVNHHKKNQNNPPLRKDFPNAEFNHPYPQTNAVINEKTCEQHILRCVQKILAQIDQQKVTQKYENKIKQLSQEIQQLLSQQSTNKLKLQKLQMLSQTDQEFSQQQERTKRELQLNINDFKQRISNAQENLSFCQSKYTEIIQSNRHEFFDIDSEIIYQKIYEEIDSLHILIRVIFLILRNILSDNYGLIEIKDHLELDLSTSNQNILEMRQQIQQMQVDHQNSLQQLRQEMMVRYYAGIQDQQTNLNNNNALKRMDQKDKKNYQRKIVDLTKANRQITHQVEMLRRKNNVVQEKYQNIRLLLSKDKGIGRPKQADQISRDRKNKNMLEEIDELSNQLDSMKFEKLRKTNSLVQQNPLRQSQHFEKKQENSEFQYSVNKWQCLGKIDAHNSAVLSIAVHANMLISTSTKSLKIWDLETSKIISDLSGTHLTGLVKYVIVEPERNIMLTACEKTVTVWDLVTLNVECTLKAHKDEVRTMHIANDILFTGGKGLANSGSLLIWDLRCLDPTKPQEQKQRNQDIFTFASRNNTLYYGTRNHHVRRMDMTSMQILAPFEPPHMDTVSGLAIVGDKMVSGSKDKNLRLWNLEHTVGNLKNTVHAFNDYVTTVQSPQVENWQNQSQVCPYPIFYAGSKDGQIKIGNTKGDKINFMGNIMGHTQAVNGISLLDDNSTLVSASADKTIKLWKPTIQTQQNMRKQFE